MWVEILTTDVTGKFVTSIPIDNVPRIYQENWPLALKRFLIMVGLSMQNLMANITSFSPWPEQHEVGSGVILPCNYIIRKR